MATTSLWELRKRPLPHGVVSPLVPSPALPLSHRKTTSSAKIRPKTKEKSKASRGLEPAFEAADRCMYRGGGTCFAARTFKDCGARHSLCAMHRDRTIANQRRYDKKKRLKKIEEAEAEEKQRKETRDRDRMRRAAKVKTAANGKMPRKTVEMSLPSFQEWSATFSECKIDNDRDTEAAHRAAEHERDPSRAWLTPFQSTDGTAGFVAWQEDAVAQFLREI